MLQAAGRAAARQGSIEVADIFRRHGDTYRQSHGGHLDRSALRVMGAIEACRTATLGGHVERCTDCGHQRIAYNSCRNRHCPKCQGTVARDWLAARQADLLPVAYFHMVFTLPQPIAAIAYQNKAVVYAILFEAAAETLKTIAGDERHLGAEIGLTAVLHTWGQTLTHHPHVHCIVPGGGLSRDGTRWVSCRPGFFLPVRVLSRLYRRLFLEKLTAAHGTGRLRFFGDLAGLGDGQIFAAYLAPCAGTEWVVYAKRPFAGPTQVLSYLSRYTHRVAISNRRLRRIEDDRVTFTWKDYRRKGANRLRTMALEPHEFIRRFLLHVLPDGFHRIRHYGFLANGHRARKLAAIRSALDAAPPEPVDGKDAGICKDESACELPPCPCCGGRMEIIEMLPGPRHPRHRRVRLDSS